MEGIGHRIKSPNTKPTDIQNLIEALIHLTNTLKTVKKTMILTDISSKKSRK